MNVPEPAAQHQSSGQPGSQPLPVVSVEKISEEISKLESQTIANPTGFAQSVQERNTNLKARKLALQHQNKL